MTNEKKDAAAGAPRETLAPSDPVVLAEPPEQFDPELARKALATAQALNRALTTADTDAPETREPGRGR